MTSTVGQPYFLQPMQAFFFRLRPLDALHKQRHSDVFDCCELGKQIMKLPYKSKFTAPEVCGSFLGEPTQIELREVYVTFRSPINNSEDMQ